MTVEHLVVSRFELLAAHRRRKGPRRFRLLANSGAVIDRLGGRAVFELKGIEYADKIPVLCDHDCSQRVGFSDSVELKADGLWLSGVLLSNEAGAQFAQDSDEGFPWQASIGLQVSEWDSIGHGESEVVNGRKIEGPCAVAKKSRLLEVSVLMAGADKHTHAIALSAQARAQNQRPGETVQMKTLSPEQMWADPKVQAEFGGNQKAFAHMVRRGRIAELNVKPTAAPRRSPEQMWNDPKVRAEFGNSQSAFAHMVRRGLISELGPGTKGDSAWLARARIADVASSKRTFRRPGCA